MRLTKSAFIENWVSNNNRIAIANLWIWVETPSRKTVETDNARRYQQKSNNEKYMKNVIKWRSENVPINLNLANIFVFATQILFFFIYFFAFVSMNFHTIPSCNWVWIFHVSRRHLPIQYMYKWIGKKNRPFRCRRAECSRCRVTEWCQQQSRPCIQIAGIEKSTSVQTIKM